MDPQVLEFLAVNRHLGLYLSNAVGSCGGSITAGEMAAMSCNPDEPVGATV